MYLNDCYFTPKKLICYFLTKFYVTRFIDKIDFPLQFGSFADVII